jgi:hypothetical protein
MRTLFYLKKWRNGRSRRTELRVSKAHWFLQKSLLMSQEDMKGVLSNGRTEELLQKVDTYLRACKVID